MDNEQLGTPRKPYRDLSTAMSETTSGSDRQLARTKGLARMSALTLGAGAASALGAVAIAITLPGSTAATSASAAPVVSSPSSRPSLRADEDRSDDGDSDEDDGTSQVQPAAPSQVQPAAPPSNTNIPPVATSGAS